MPETIPKVFTTMTEAYEDAEDAWDEAAEFVGTLENILSADGTLIPTTDSKFKVGIMFTKEVPVE